MDGGLRRVIRHRHQMACEAAFGKKPLWFGIDV
jgi:hypothetical protein